MIETSFNGMKTLLCLGAHADDLEIGCGGTVLRLVAENPGLSVFWVTLSAGGVREVEARAGSERFLEGAGGKTVEILQFRDGFFPYLGAGIKEYFELLKTKVSPDLILTHFRHDLHQDHRLTCELTWNTFRDHLILEYEVPKWDGDLGSPNCYVTLEPPVYEKKVEYVLESFPSQAGKHWFKKETFMGLMRLRGMESNSPSGYAEGFYARKFVL